MKQLLDKISRLYPLHNDDLEQLLAVTTSVLLPKGTVLFKEGTVTGKVFIIEQGIARAFTSKAGKEVTFWFGMDGDIILQMCSYVANSPGYETVMLLEDSLLHQFDNTSLQKLYTSNIHIANWGRRLAEYELLQTEERFISLQFHSARERYVALIKKNPELVQHIQLGYIASYLGISQVTLSRIRAELATESF
ncbi:MAG: Crp/Fnr family transcriptional regulator [Chitinophagaceae bacterium]